MKSRTLAKALVVKAVFVLAALTVFSSPANALFVMQLSDGINSVTIYDGMAGDSNATTGAITFNGGLGTNWIVNVTTGLSDPVLPANGFNVSMDLNSVNVSTLSGGTLTIKLSDTDFSLSTATSSPNALGTMSIGGTTNGTVKYDAFYDNSNAEFGTGGVIGSLGAFGAGAFSGTVINGLDVDSLFSLTQVITITHAAGAGISSSFNAELDVQTPEPGTLLLLGTGLAGMGLVIRRRRAV